MNLPEFKYNPNALKLGIFEETDATCPVCNQQRGYRYTGPFYCRENPEDICPWCIKDGSAAKKYKGEFVDSASIEGYSGSPDVPGNIPYPPEAIDELIHRTPSYSGWQQEAWPGHCNDLCAFIDYAGSADIAPFLDELREDIDSFGYDEGMVEESLEKNGTLAGYLFQCLHCGKHRLHVDSE
ncbi:hypothetical protein C7N43_27940 [Sphingobacteriales bacterium UPWRP_1]|nr:hypothetical protein B6N25_16585 [Sphingobacteriales bacterium TSM_CSS]PSJ73657.1 hypothetical protein C7N43_27940 [Sphingobacteriales bacterium UPWRP_1]